MPTTIALRHYTNKMKILFGKCKYNSLALQIHARYLYIEILSNKQFSPVAKCCIRHMMRWVKIEILRGSRILQETTQTGKIKQSTIGIGGWLLANRVHDLETWEQQNSHRNIKASM